MPQTTRQNPQVFHVEQPAKNPCAKDSRHQRGPQEALRAIRMKTNRPAPTQPRRRKSSSQELRLLPITGPQGSFQEIRMKTNRPAPTQPRRRKSSSQELRLLPIAGPQGSFQKIRMKTNRPAPTQPRRRRRSSQELRLLPITGPHGSFQEIRMKTNRPSPAINPGHEKVPHRTLRRSNGTDKTHQHGRAADHGLRRQPLAE